MRRALLVSLSIGLLTSLSAGCTAAGDQVESVRSIASDVAGAAGFCLSLTRAVAAVESGSPATAEEAAEEALARAPDDLVDGARRVAEAVRQVRDEGDGIPADPQLTEALEQLIETARHTCQPD